MALFITKMLGEKAIRKLISGLINIARILALMRVQDISEYAFYYMMDYLTNVWNLSTTHAAGIINIWNGMTPVLILISVVCVDAFVGNYYMIVFAGIVQSVGLGLLFMSMPPVLSSCNDYKEECVRHTQKALLYTALPLIALGKAGFAVSLGSFLKSQAKKDAEDMLAEINTYSALKEALKEALKVFNKPRVEEEKEHRLNIDWRLIALCGEHVLLVTVIMALSYINPWSVRFGIPALCTLVATLVFLSGHRGYYKQGPKSEGSPLTTILRVFVAAARKILVPLPTSTRLYNEEGARSTKNLRYLDKAAIKLRAHEPYSKWKLCSVQEVEDTKTAVRILPMWLTFILPGIVLSIGNTYFLEQANRMDRNVGKIKITLPFFLLFYNYTSFLFKFLYGYLPKCLPKKKYAPPVGIAIGMIISVLCCITAAKVETQRLHRIRDHGLMNKPDERIPMTIFILFPQILLLGAVDGITTKSIECFFKHESPKLMEEYMPYFSKGVLGLGKMASVLSVYVVGKVSERNHKPNWFQYTINDSRLDRYYWVLAMLSAGNLVIYVIVAFFSKYQESDDDEDDDDDDNQNPIMLALSSLTTICGDNS